MKIIKIKDLAILLGVSLPTAYRMLCAGRLPAAIEGTKPPRWDAERVEAWIKGRAPSDAVSG